MPHRKHGHACAADSLINDSHFQGEPDLTGLCPMQKKHHSSCCSHLNQPQQVFSQCQRQLNYRELQSSQPQNFRHTAADGIFLPSAVRLVFSGLWFFDMCAFLNPLDLTSGSIHYCCFFSLINFILLDFSLFCACCLGTGEKQVIVRSLSACICWVVGWHSCFRWHLPLIIIKHLIFEVVLVKYVVFLCYTLLGILVTDCYGPT